MIVAGLLGGGLVAAVAGRLFPLGRGRALGVAGLAFAARAVAAAAVTWYAWASRGGPIWLDDEASYTLATRALAPDPFQQPLPPGLSQLGGNAYLGLTTLLFRLFGPDPTVPRAANVVLGTLAVLLAMHVAERLLDRRRTLPAASGRGDLAGTQRQMRLMDRRALAAGVLVALWPMLWVWAALILRDTLVSFAILAAWWSLLLWQGGSRPRAGLVGFLALSLLWGLRPHLLPMVGLALALALAVPRLRRLPPGTLALVVLACLGLAAGFAATQGARVQQATQAVAYKQTATRLEALGRLYFPAPEGPPQGNVPLPVGSLVVEEVSSGGALAGVVQAMPAPDARLVAFTDQSLRVVPVASLRPFQAVPVSAARLLEGLGAGLATVFLGASDAPSEPASRLIWIADALTWDLLLLAAALGAWRARLRLAQLVFPAVVVAGTLLVLVVVPGAAGNAARHRTVQTAPLLLVLAAGLAPAVGWRGAWLGRSGLSSASRIPASAVGPTSSRSRSAH